MNKTIELMRKATVLAGAGVIFAGAFFQSSFGQPTNAPAADASVDLTPSQLSAIKIEPLGTHVFPVQRSAIGSIDYNEDLSVQVFSSYPGKIITNFVELGDKVKKGQPLFSIASPDLVQAESTFIAALASNILYSNELVRAKSLHGTNGISEREFEQATSDAHTAEGALKAARDTLRVFGLTEGEINQIAASGKVKSDLPVRSPVTGRVTARYAQPGLLVQPGATPAPFAVADLSTKWLVANAAESDSPRLRVGQTVEAALMAYPGRVFHGKIAALGAAVDPNTHRLMLRCVLDDPNDELRPGMLAAVTIEIEAPVNSLAIPMNGVVRDGDGTMAAWVTTDRHHFLQRIIKTGLQNDGRYQVLEGLHPGELAVTDGAVFVSNILYAPPTD